jgi:Lecithin:cholesterol acyltransferase
MTGTNPRVYDNEVKDIGNQFDTDLIKDSDIRILWFDLAPGYNKIARLFKMKGWSIRNPANNWQGRPEDTKERIYYEFPYDWRQDIRKHAMDLNKFVTDRILPEFSNPDIYLISHSTGGIISRAYLSNKYLDDGSGILLPPHPRIKKQILIGVPNHGAPKAYRVAKTGTGFANNRIPGQYLPPNVKQLSAKWPLVYQLMATRQYEKYFNDPLYGPIARVGPVGLPTVRETYIESAHIQFSDLDIIRRYCLNEDDLVNNAASLHDDLGRDTFLPVGDTYAIYSDKLETVTGLTWNVTNDNYNVNFQENGDGTVPAKSVYDLKGLSEDGGTNPQPYNSEDDSGFDPNLHHLIRMNNIFHAELPAHIDVLPILSSIVDFT